MVGRAGGERPRDRRGRRVRGDAGGRRPCDAVGRPLDLIPGLDGRAVRPGQVDPRPGGRGHREIRRAEQVGRGGYGRRIGRVARAVGRADAIRVGGALRQPGVDERGRVGARRPDLGPRRPDEALDLVAGLPGHVAPGEPDLGRGQGRGGGRRRGDRLAGRGGDDDGRRGVTARIGRHDAEPVGRPGREVRRLVPVAAQPVVRRAPVEGVVDAVGRVFDPILILVVGGVRPGEVDLDVRGDRRRQVHGRRREDLGRGGRRDVRVRRVVAVVRTHPEVVGDARRPGDGRGRDVGPGRGDDGEVDAVGRALDLVARLIGRDVRPGQIDERRRPGDGRQVDRGGRGRARPARGRGGVGGGPCSVVGPDAEPVDRAGREARRLIRRLVGPGRPDLREGHAVRGSLDPVAGLVRGGVVPAQVDRRARGRGRLEVGRRVEQRRRRPGDPREGRVARRVGRPHAVGVRRPDRRGRVGERPSQVVDEAARTDLDEIHRVGRPLDLVAGLVVGQVGPLQVDPRAARRRRRQHGRGAGRRHGRRGGRDVGIGRGLGVGVPGLDAEVVGDARGQPGREVGGLIPAGRGQVREGDAVGRALDGVARLVRRRIRPGEVDVAVAPRHGRQVGRGRGHEPRGGGGRRGVRRVALAVAAAHPEVVGDAGREAGGLVGALVRGARPDLGEVHAVGRPLDLESRLVARLVVPAQVDLRAGGGRGVQGPGGRDRRRGGRRHGGGRREGRVARRGDGADAIGVAGPGDRLIIGVIQAHVGGLVRDLGEIDAVGRPLDLVGGLVRQVVRPGQQDLGRRRRDRLQVGGVVVGRYRDLDGRGEGGRPLRVVGADPEVRAAGDRAVGGRGLVRVGAGVGREVHAVERPLDVEPRLVVGVVGPVEPDLGVRQGDGRQARRRGRQEGRRRGGRDGRRGRVAGRVVGLDAEPVGGRRGKARDAEGRRRRGVDGREGDPVGRPLDPVALDVVGVVPPGEVDLDAGDGDGGEFERGGRDDGGPGRGDDVRRRGVVAVRGSDPEVVGRAERHGRRVGRGVLRQRLQGREVDPVRGTFDLVAGLVRRQVGPREVDLDGRGGGRRQVDRRRRRDARPGRDDGGPGGVAGGARGADPEPVVRPGGEAGRRIARLVRPDGRQRREGDAVGRALDLVPGLVGRGVVPAQVDPGARDDGRDEVGRRVEEQGRGRGDVRARRIARGVGRADAELVRRAGGEAGRRVGGLVCVRRRQQGPGHAVGRPLDLIAGLVVGGLAPGQVDLGTGRGRGREDERGRRRLDRRRRRDDVRPGGILGVDGAHPEVIGGAGRQARGIGGRLVRLRGRQQGEIDPVRRPLDPIARLIRRRVRPGEVDPVGARRDGGQVEGRRRDGPDSRDGHVGVGRLARSVIGPHAELIRRPQGQPGHREGRLAGRGRSGRRPRHAVGRAFDPEARLVARVVRPVEGRLRPRGPVGGQRPRGRDRRRRRRGRRRVARRRARGVAVGPDAEIVGGGGREGARDDGPRGPRRGRDDGGPGDAVRGLLDDVAALRDGGVGPGHVDPVGGEELGRDARRRGEGRGRGRDDARRGRAGRVDGRDAIVVPGVVGEGGVREARGPRPRRAGRDP